LNKESLVLTPDVIEECLCESFDITEKHINIPLHDKTQKTMK
jgi:hypothetical protein